MPEFRCVVPEQPMVPLLGARALGLGAPEGVRPARGPRPCPGVPGQVWPCVMQEEVCPICGGTGTLPGDRVQVPCPECEGNGLEIRASMPHVEVTPLDPIGPCDRCYSGDPHRGSGTVPGTLTADPEERFCDPWCQGARWHGWLIQGTTEDHNG